MVLKKDAKTGFSVSVELLIGDRLSVCQQLANKPVTMLFCTEKQACQLLAGVISISNMYVHYICFLFDKLIFIHI